MEKIKQHWCEELSRLILFCEENLKILSDVIRAVESKNYSLEKNIKLVETGTDILDDMNDRIQFFTELLYNLQNKHLEEISESEMVYYSPGELNNLLLLFGIEIPKHELERMKNEIVHVDIEEVKVQSALIKKLTHNRIPPLFMVLPRVVLIDGKEEFFSLNLFSAREDGDSEFTTELRKKWQALREKGIRVFNFIALRNRLRTGRTKIENETNNFLCKTSLHEHPTLYSGNSISGMNGTSQKFQEEYIQTEVGENSLMHMDGILAHYMHYLGTEHRTGLDGMRVKANPNHPLILEISQVGLNASYFEIKNYAEDRPFGMGASYTFTPKTK